MKNNTDTATQAPKALLNDLHALVAEAEKMIGASHADLSEDAIGALRARFDAAQERLSEFYMGARKQVVAGARYTDDAIRANPYQSLAIAAGVGLVIGVLAGSRSK